MNKSKLTLTDLSLPDLELVQRGLKDCGHYRGPIDRDLGPMTRAAYAEFWKAEEVPTPTPAPAEPGGLEERSLANLATLPDEKIRRRFTAFAIEANEIAANFGCRFVVLSGHRSLEKQRELYNAYKAGRGGKAAAPGYSWHNYGRAIDGAIMKGGQIVDGRLKGHRYMDSQDPKLARAVYLEIGMLLAKKYGLRHGINFGDPPHFAFAATDTPTSEDRRSLS